MLSREPGIFICVFCVLSLLIIYHFWMYLSGLFFHVTGNPPWLLRSVKSLTTSELCLDCFSLLSFTRSFILAVADVTPQVLRIWESLFHPEPFFTLYSFPTFDACTTSICFYQDFPGSRQFLLEVCKASHCSSKHRPAPSVCLNHTVFHKYVINQELYLNF